MGDRDAPGSPGITRTRPVDRATVPDEPILLVVEGPDAGARLTLKEGTAIIGQAAACDLCLRDSAVSRRHLEITVADAGIVARDLGSKNGSFLFGSRFDRVELNTGAIVELGGTRLQLLGAPSVELELWPDDVLGTLYGRSVAMRRVFTLLHRLASAELSVLIVGETGTGKEEVARSLHAVSARSAEPLVIVDLAGLNDQLIESELFGHVRGAFTGAHDHRVGAFEAAGRGSVFLDEIGEMSLTVQPRLLRALEARQVKPVGASTYRGVTARTIAATNRDLPLEVQQGRFRGDLYHRLAGATIAIPPLRERREDIPGLVERIVARLGQADPALGALRVPAEMMTLLQAYDWPGNVRQLRNVLERAHALTGPGRELRPEVLGIDAALAAGAAAAADPGIDERTDRVSVAVDPAVPFKEAKELLIEAWEREYLSRLLARHDGRVSDAAREAGIDRAHLHRLLKKHGFRRSYG